jgi:hypothetical protein
LVPGSLAKELQEPHPLVPACHGGT